MPVVSVGAALLPERDDHLRLAGERALVGAGHQRLEVAGQVAHRDLS